MFTRLLRPAMLRRVAMTVLILYGLTLGLATAAPLLQQSQGSSIICTSTGFITVDAAGKVLEQDLQSAFTDRFHCALCLPLSLMPGIHLQEASPTPHALSYAIRSIPAAYLAAIVSAPLPARGPPAHC